jgi:hypothetical protein
MVAAVVVVFNDGSRGMGSEQPLKDLNKIHCY